MDELIMMSVYVPMDVDVSIDVDIPIKVSMDAHVSTVVIIVVIPTASRNYTVYGLNGHRSHYIISSFKVT
jgi:hypothetical protein